MSLDLPNEATNPTQPDDRYVMPANEARQRLGGISRRTFNGLVKRGYLTLIRYGDAPNSRQFVNVAEVKQLGKTGLPW